MFKCHFTLNNIFAAFLLVIVSLTAHPVFCEAAPRHQAVLKMEPVGYWPVDAGEGNQLRDLSQTANHGHIYHVPWDDERNLLDFTSAYQWLEIPRHPRYQTESFSMGGWVFLRSEVIGSGWPNRQGLLFLGNKHWLNEIGVQFCIRRSELIDVVMNGKEDILGTRLWVGDVDGKRIRKGQGEPRLPIGQWQHLIFTFKPSNQQPEGPSAPNLALQATVTASNDGGHAVRAPKNVIDGKLDTQWITWPGAGPEADSEKWIQLDFPEEITINRVRLIGREGRTDYFKAGILHFSDGSSIEIPSLIEGWDGLFTDKKTQWVRFEGSQTVGPRPGLKEFGVYKEDRTVYPEEGVIKNRVLGEGGLGMGTLYLNGLPIKTVQDIVYNPSDENLQIGNDAYWWHQQAGKSGSLDGSVRDLVWFDRALNAEEVAHLHATTHPETQPVVFSKETLVLNDFEYGDISVNGRAISLNDWPNLNIEERRELLEDLEKREPLFLKKRFEKLHPLLKNALHDWQTRRAATALLVTTENTEASETLLNTALPICAKALADKDLPKEARAESALALAAMGKQAESAVPVIADALEQILKTEGDHFPRVEDLARNAIIRALLDIAPAHLRSRQALEEALAKPLFQTVNLTPIMQEKLQNHLDAEEYMLALDAFRNLSPASRGELFFTDRDTGVGGDYTATAHYEGYTYKVGTGRAWEGVEEIPDDEYKTIVSQVAKEYPAATKWRPADFEHLYRVPLTKISPDGTEQKLYLEGENFILDGNDAKVRAWSIFVDELGYVHLMGGQHNSPNPDYYIPGSWEKMGISRDRNSDDYPQQMYWISTKPGRIDEFEFAGRRSDPRAIPASYLNYLVFLQSPKNETYLYGRANAFGFQCWGMFQYSATEKRWSPIGGDPYSIIQSARQANPEWLAFLHDPVRGGAPTEPSDIQRLAWAWQPPFYNFCRDQWGGRFDATGRLHIHMQISGLSLRGYNRLSSVYAWSDDRGKTFHRADGSPVELPLTINPAPKNNAEIYAGSTLQWWNLWISLIRYIGYEVPRPSKA